MRKILLLLLFISFINSKVYSQDYMDEICKKTCDCIENISDTIERESYEMQMGLCMINAAMPYKKQLKKDHKINMDDIGNEAEKLGTLIGIRMASICPKSLMKFSENSENNKEDTEQHSVEGLITKIEFDPFIVFTLKDEKGKSIKYHWLTFIETKIDLQNKYNTLTNKNVKITYTTTDFFDPKIQEYRQFNIIKTLEIN